MNLNEMRRETRKYKTELKELTGKDDETIQYNALRLYVQAERHRKDGGEVVLRDKGGQVTRPS